MKNLIRILFVIVFVNFLSVQAQPMAGMPPGPRFGGAMDKLFGDNQAFSATIETQMKNRSGDTMTMPGKILFDSGKTRFETDATKMSGSKMSPDMGEQLKQMGMDKMTMISRPDKAVSYILYPGFQAYVETPIKNTTTNSNDFDVKVTELGKETVNGHACIKNKVVVTEKNGDKHESTVWNATDLKNFPIKISTNENGNDVTMLFTDVKIAKQDSESFNPPSDYKKYNDMGQLMREQMMKRMGGMPY